MDKQTFLDKMKEIGTCEDEVARRTLLSELSDEVSNVFDSNATLTEANTNLTNDNEALRSANMKLFLRVGEQKSPDEVNKNSTGLENKEPEKRKFEDLFNENGGIK